MRPPAKAEDDHVLFGRVFTHRQGRDSSLQSRIIRVAVVDDEPTMRAVLEDLVSGHDACELVGSGACAADAVELARALHPDVILLDVMLPGGGAAAARGILESSPRTAVVAISAYTDRGHVSRMYAAGAVSYLTKRSSMLDIISAIEAAADGR